MGVKFGIEEGTEGPLLRAKFHPHRCDDKGIGPNVTLIGKRGPVQEPPKVKIYQKLWFSATGSQHNEHIHMKFDV